MQANPLKQRAQALLQQGQLEQAKGLYEQLCRQNGMDAEARYMLGSINGQLGNFPEAVFNYREAIKLQPAAFVAHCGLGAALKKQDMLAEAGQAFREALRLKPDSPDVLLELAELLQKQAKLTEARECFQKVLALNPGSGKALHGLGETHQSQGQLDEAISWYRQALKINPDRARTHNLLGTALYSKGDPEQAITQYRRALELRPAFPAAHNNLGLALMAAGKLDAAKNAFQDALQIKPDYVDAIVGEATVLDRLGDFQAAYDRLAPLIERGVEHVGLGQTYAEICRRLDNCEDAADYLERLLTKDRLALSGRRNVHFTLGMLYDRLGSYDKAFRNYQKANALQPDSFDPNKHKAMIEEYIRLFTWNFMMKTPRATERTELPVFIVGMPRSGTSLVEQVLASHPDVFGAGELTDIGDLASSLPARLGTASGYPACLSGLTAETADNLAQSYLAHLRELAPGAVRVTDKMPQNFYHLGLIALLFPGARIIHCTRDPRDTCLSIYFQNFSASHSYATSLEHIAAYYRQYEQLMQHWKTFQDLPLLEVHYEDMIANQEAVSRKLVAFTGLEWDERCLAFHDTSRYTVTASYDQVRQPIYSRSIGRWRNYEPYLGPLLGALEDAKD